ncbi:hypothetical protein PIB30_060250 [Stylosanthes scabra]|uniref:Uncharacterized protein n=1 Tax=Stylosanthes scabra TaxID=79078 RepID=A0ABU6ZJ73_9FABA|nr:hypothetical protein [Stylosanthes scabra]
MKHFLSNDNVLYGPSSRNKTALQRTNNFIQKRPKSIDKNFGDDFINYVAKTDRSKLFHTIRSVHFGDQDEQGLKDRSIQRTHPKKLCTQFSKCQCRSAPNTL